jgi:hypothetical protein
MAPVREKNLAGSARSTLLRFAQVTRTAFSPVPARCSVWSLITKKVRGQMTTSGDVCYRDGSLILP